MKIGETIYNKSSKKKYLIIEIHTNGKILLLSPGGIKCPYESKEHVLKYFRYDLKEKLDKLLNEN